MRCDKIAVIIKASVARIIAVNLCTSSNVTAINSFTATVLFQFETLLGPTLFYIIVALISRKNVQFYQ